MHYCPKEDKKSIGYNSFKDKSKYIFNVIIILTKYVSKTNDRFFHRSH